MKLIVSISLAIILGFGFFAVYEAARIIIEITGVIQ